ncbi:MAG: hypothetical protein JSS02_28910 [Planctomycetes bacterium]|nr:hypothetical protein [Planctomycetota bacterium]
MARLSRREVYAPHEIAIVHVINRVNQGCFLLGTDPFTGKNLDHRKAWMEDQLRRQAACFAIDLLGFAILPDRFHLILRSRPDCVKQWDDTDIARRWLTICPVRKTDDGQPAPPTTEDVNLLRLNRTRLKAIRSRLSDISWWTRIFCQQIAKRANDEDEQRGKFFQSRFKAVRLLDEQALVACAVHVDLKPVIASQAKPRRSKAPKAAKRRLQTVPQTVSSATAGVLRRKSAKRNATAASGRRAAAPSAGVSATADQFLTPVEFKQRKGAAQGAELNKAGARCSDKGFLPFSQDDYFQLLDWTSRQLTQGQKGRVPESIEPILQQLQLDRETWCDLVAHFDKRFFVVAGALTTIDDTTSRLKQHRYHVPLATRQLFQDIESRTETSE